VTLCVGHARFWNAFSPWILRSLNFLIHLIVNQLAGILTEITIATSLSKSTQLNPLFQIQTRLFSRLKIIGKRSELLSAKVIALLFLTTSQKS